jgi:hypothetical protein
MPAGMLIMSSLRGVRAESLLPQTEQKVRERGVPDWVVGSV